MNLEDTIKEYEKIKLQSSVDVQKHNKSFPHIISKASFEEIIMNAAEHVVSPPAQANTSIQQHVSPPTQQTSVITANSSHRKISIDDKRLRCMQRQQNVEEKESVKNDFDKSKDVCYKDSLNNIYSIKDNVVNSSSSMKDNSDDLADYRTYSMRQHLSFESALRDANVKRDSYHREMKSKSLDILEDGHRHVLLEPPFHRTKHSSFNYEDEHQLPRMSTLHISPSAYTNALQISPPHLYTDVRTSQSPRLVRRSSPQISIPNSQDHNVIVSVLRGKQNSLRNAAIQNDAQTMPYFKRIQYESQQSRQYKYGQRKANSAVAYSPYHREKTLRKHFSEEIFPENKLVERKRNNESRNLPRSSSYDTFDASLLRQKPLSKSSDVVQPRDLIHQKTNKHASTKTSSPELDNIKEYGNVFTKPIDDEFMHMLNINRMVEKSLLHGNELVSSYIQEDEKEKRKNENAKSKCFKPQQNDIIYNTGPYVYDKEIDDEIAVCVSGLLTLPGSNEKRYPITVGELRRRISPPEYLNKVDMISYVRLAKTSARELLEKHAIRPKHHSRKSKHSVISKMCEAESAEFANGIKTLSESYFPKEWLVQQQLEKIERSSDVEVKFAEEQNKLKIARAVLQDLALLIESQKSANEMQPYNLATHAYGLSNLTHNIELITSFLQTQGDAINKKLRSTEIGYTVNEDTPMETTTATEKSNGINKTE